MQAAGTNNLSYLFPYREQSGNTSRVNLIKKSIPQVQHVLIELKV